MLYSTTVVHFVPKADIEAYLSNWMANRREIQPSELVDRVKW
jgi:hypothetical protein